MLKEVLLGLLILVGCVAGYPSRPLSVLVEQASYQCRLESQLIVNSALIIAESVLVAPVGEKRLLWPADVSVVHQRRD